MSAVACLVCGDVRPADQMMIVAKGSLCPACQAHAELEREVFRGSWLTAISGPVTAASFSVLGLVLSCLGLIGPALWLIGGVLAIFAGIRALLVFWSLRDPHAEVKTSAFTLGTLAVSGVVTGLWGLGLCTAALLTVLAQWTSA